MVKSEFESNSSQEEPINWKATLKINPSPISFEENGMIRYQTHTTLFGGGRLRPPTSVVTAVIDATPHFYSPTRTLLHIETQLDRQGRPNGLIGRRFTARCFADHSLNSPWWRLEYRVSPVNPEIAELAPVVFTNRERHARWYTVECSLPPISRLESFPGDRSSFFCNWSS